jgi:hypothetical protein
MIAAMETEMSILEHVSAEEASQIDNIIRLTRQQLEKRYPEGRQALRAQHAKAHACVSGTLTVRDDLPPHRRRGVFAHPGQEYQIWVRYSNAAAIPGADSAVASGVFVAHGGRGMAIKIVSVAGTPLTPTDGSVDQDFLLVNHPVFPFANVADYEAITQVLAADDKPDRFFAERVRMKGDGSPDLADPVTRGALRTLGIVKRIQSLSTTAQPPAFQRPPSCPVDNQYFGAAPFLFGEDKVMRVRVSPTSAAADDELDAADPDYLRTRLARRLTSPDAAGARFEFQLQIRDASTLAVDTDIEDACVDWDETRFPFETLAIVNIPPQDFGTDERRASCEALSFSPWHGITDHRPLGGINRLRRAVYEASSVYRQASSPSHQ